MNTQQNKINMKRPMKLYLFVDSLKNRVSIQLLYHKGDESSWKYHTLGSLKIPKNISNKRLTEICKLLDLHHTVKKLAKNIGLNKTEYKIIKELAEKIEAELLKNTPETKLAVMFFKSASKQFYPSAKRAEYLLGIHQDIVTHIEDI